MSVKIFPKINDLKQTHQPYNTCIVGKIKHISKTDREKISDNCMNNNLK